jgi:hypothetical protein
MVAGELNAYDILVNDWVVFTDDTLPGEVESIAVEADTAADPASSDAAVGADTNAGASGETDTEGADTEEEGSGS